MSKTLHAFPGGKFMVPFQMIGASTPGFSFYAEYGSYNPEQNETVLKSVEVEKHPQGQTPDHILLEVSVPPGAPSDTYRLIYFERRCRVGDRVIKEEIPTEQMRGYADLDVDESAENPTIPWPNLPR